jgi:hypothetical protein
MLPSKHSDTAPRSSLTTTTTASVSCVMPSAARWRAPSVRSTAPARGKKAPACHTRPSRITSAPSCMGFSKLGMKMV